MACEEKCYTFTWRLENVSYCLQKKDTAIYSPAFVVDSINETKWYLGLYPRGEDDANYISFYLFREEDSQSVAGVDINYELVFVAKDGSVLTPWQKIRYDFVPNNGHGFPKFAKRADVFMGERSAFLPQDTLTARCRIWKSVGEMENNVRCFARTRVGVQKRSFLWHVKNFSTLESGKNFHTYKIKSLGNVKQIMFINLSLTEGLSSEEMIKFELSLQDQAIKFATLQLSLVDASGSRVECNRDEFWFDNRSNSKEFKFFFTKNKLMAMKSSYLPDDTLTLHWEWAFSKGVISKEIEDVQSFTFTKSESKFPDAENVNKQSIVPVSYSLNDNLKSLYDENFLCDVKLKTSTSLFNAHKVILSAASPVFKAMFSNDMKEKVSDCVNIEDLSDDTVSRMLLFIYTTRAEDLTWERASHLYVAADKYDISSLKKICSSYIKDNLSSSNACEVLLLSNIHGDEDLKSDVQNYILKNVKDVIKSDGWKILMEYNAKLAAETLCLQHK